MGVFKNWYRIKFHHVKDKKPIPGRVIIIPYNDAWVAGVCKCRQMPIYLDDPLEERWVEVDGVPDWFHIQSQWAYFPRIGFSKPKFEKDWDKLQKMDLLELRILANKATRRKLWFERLLLWIKEVFTKNESSNKET